MNIRFWLVIFFVLSLFGCQNKEEPKEDKEVIPSVNVKTKEDRKTEAVASVKLSAASSQAVGQSQRVSLESIEGRKLGDLYADYLGLTKGERVPGFTKVSFEERMSLLYQRKLTYKKCNKKGDCVDASETTISQFPELYRQYLERDKSKMPLHEFVSIAGKKIISAKKSLDWDAVCHRYEDKKHPKGKISNQKRCNLLRTLTANLTGKDLIAYGMTEIFPSSDGRLNVLYMDILLKNAGAEYLYHIPALADGYASLGLYQFTMFALRKDEEATEGASIINSFVKDGGEKISDSVVKLSGHEQHVAAFYFAVHNLSRLIFGLSDQGVQALYQKRLDYKHEIVMYVAAAHHAPEVALARTMSWVHHGMKSSLIRSYRGHRIREYADKTKVNLLAIYEG